MQRTILPFLFIFFACSALLQAQTQQGNFITGASSEVALGTTSMNVMSLSFGSVTTKSDAPLFQEQTEKITSINLSPRLGYFVIDRLAAGLEITYAYLKNTDDDSEAEFSQSLFAAGPFVRYYFSTGSLLPYAEAYGALGSSSLKEFDPDFPNFDLDSSSDELYWGASLGLAAALGEKVTWDIGLNYRYNKSEPSENNIANTRIVSNSFGLKFGFSVFLGSNDE